MVDKFRMKQLIPLYTSEETIVVAMRVEIIADHPVLYNGLVPLWLVTFLRELPSSPQLEILSSEFEMRETLCYCPHSCLVVLCVRLRTYGYFGSCVSESFWSSSFRPLARSS